MVGDKVIRNRVLKNEHPKYSIQYISLNQIYYPD